MKHRLALGAGLLLLASTRPALGTYSIVGSDSMTRQTGGAGTSCLRGSDVYIIYGSAPGRGTVHAQALANQAGRNRAVELLEQGVAPAEIIAAITASSFDANAAARQYGVVDVMGRSAGFTGNSANAFADDVQGQVGAFSYSVQGNILTSAAVLTQAAAAFEASSGCDLADRLMRALEAGAENGEGDNRCTESLGIPSDSAYLQVEAPDTARGSFLSLRVRTSGRDNPMVALRADYDAWRSMNPCEPGGGGNAGAGGGSSGGQAVGGSAPGGAGGANGAGNVGGAGTSDTGGGGTTAGGSASGGSAGTMISPESGAAGVTPTPTPADDEGGCGCRVSRSRTSLAVFGVVLGGALLRLRRHSRRR